jgi:hypothetical protein
MGWNSVLKKTADGFARQAEECDKAAKGFRDDPDFGKHYGSGWVDLKAEELHRMATWFRSQAAELRTKISD